VETDSIGDGRVRSRRRQLASFSALLFTALALVPAGAHLAEIVHKMPLSGAEYRVVQQIYGGWALFGIIVFAAILSTLLLAIALRHHAGAFVPALVALICLIGTQVIFWSLTFPVNQATVNWTVFPANWSGLRMQWEYSHAAAAGLNLIAFVSTICAVLRQTP
jgi:hypothetical protein